MNLLAKKPKIDPDQTPFTAALSLRDRIDAALADARDARDAAKAQLQESEATAGGDALKAFESGGIRALEDLRADVRRSEAQVESLQNARGAADRRVIEQRRVASNEFVAEQKRLFADIRKTFVDAAQSMIAALQDVHAVEHEMQRRGLDLLAAHDAIDRTIFISPRCGADEFERALRDFIDR